MSDFRRYGRLSDHLYKFIAAMASAHPNAGWCEREEIEMAIRFIKRLEALHDKEKEELEWERNYDREQRLQKRAEEKKKVVKLVTDESASPRQPLN